jgi:hypothetical protein
MTQIELPFIHPARNTDPGTSHEAANSIDFRANNFKVILYVLRTPMGKDGIARLSGLSGEQVCRRLTEMERLKLVRPTGKKVLSDTGRNEREWEKIK